MMVNFGIYIIIFCHEVELLTQLRSTPNERLVRSAGDCIRFRCGTSLHNFENIDSFIFMSMVSKTC